MAEFKQLITNNPDAKISTFVDDAPILATGNKYDVFTTLVQAGLEFNEITSKLFLVLSGKAEIVCSCHLLAKNSQSTKNTWYTFQNIYNCQGRRGCIHSLYQFNKVIYIIKHCKRCNYVKLIDAYFFLFIKII